MKKYGNSKYRPKFAEDLRNGLRKDGLWIKEVCALWGISLKSYYEYIDAHPTFAVAHEQGELDFTCFWATKYRLTATGAAPGNAQMLMLACKNFLDMADKHEGTNTHEERITTIKIEMLPPREVKQLGNITDGEDSNS